MNFEGTSRIAEIIDNENLTFKARGIAVKIAKLGGDRITMRQLTENKDVNGITAVRAGLNELIDSDYLIMEKGTVKESDGALRKGAFYSLIK